MSLINIAALAEQAKTYQPDLRTLPYVIIGNVLNAHGIAMKPVAGIDVVTVGERKGGLIRPYAPGTVTEQTEIMKAAERELKVEAAYISMKDNIKNYQTARIINNPSLVLGINETKENPFKDLIVANVVKTASEDVLDAMFHASRNTSDLSPLGAFTGFFKHIDTAITATEIAAGKGNLIATGALPIPGTGVETAAVDRIILFVRSADRMLKDYPAVLYMSRAVYSNAIDALDAKYPSKNIDIFALQNYINQKAQSKVVIVVSDLVGSGSRIILTVPGNFEFGINTMSAIDFVKVRSPFEDPNEMQFWLQADFGTRILSFNKKVFAINDQVNTSVALSGDYQ